MSDVPRCTISELPPTCWLVIDVLAARHRLGETCWTFPAQLRDKLRRLETVDLIGWKSGVAQGTVIAWLTDNGKAEAMSRTYEAPCVRESDTLRRARLLAHEANEAGEGWHSALDSLLALLTTETGSPVSGQTEDQTLLAGRPHTPPVDRHGWGAGSSRSAPAATWPCPGDGTTDCCEAATPGTIAGSTARRRPQPMTDGIELDQLRSANLQAWSRDTTLPDYALVANTSSSRYIPALEARVEELQAQLAEAQLRLIETQNGRTDM